MGSVVLTNEPPPCHLGRVERSSRIAVRRLGCDPAQEVPLSKAVGCGPRRFPRFAADAYSLEPGGVDMPPSRPPPGRPHQQISATTTCHTTAYDAPTWDCQWRTRRGQPVPMIKTKWSSCCGWRTEATPQLKPATGPYTSAVRWPLCGPQTVPRTRPRFRSRNDPTGRDQTRSGADNRPLTCRNNDAGGRVQA